jgi:hypothetical protein
LFQGDQGAFSIYFIQARALLAVETKEHKAIPTIILVGGNLARVPGAAFGTLHRTYLQSILQMLLFS